MKRKAPTASPAPACVTGLIRRNVPRVPGRLSSDFNLLADERALLPDPDWVTEDDADAIIARRRDNQPDIPLDEVLKRRGYLDRRAASRR